MMDIAVQIHGGFAGCDVVTRLRDIFGKTTDDWSVVHEAGDSIAAGKYIFSAWGFIATSADDRCEDVRDGFVKAAIEKMELNIKRDVERMVRVGRTAEQIAASCSQIAAHTIKGLEL
jgi:hypothetical protein